MTAPTFEWDPTKAAANLRKHRISFEEAVTAFQDPLAKVHADPEHSVSEKREILVGHSESGRLLLVAFTEREGRIRVSGARAATRRERRAYEKARRATRKPADELRPEYDFDYSKAKPNPYAARLKGRTVAVVLEPDVATAFPTSQSVNRTLRSVVAAVPRRSSRASSVRTRGGRTRG